MRDSRFYIGRVVWVTLGSGSGNIWGLFGCGYDEL